MSAILSSYSSSTKSNPSLIAITQHPIDKHPINSTKDNEVFNTRLTKRVNLSTTLFVRRPINSKRYLRQVSTINVSRYGALALSDVALEIGAELEVTRYKVLVLANKQTQSITTFAAKAIVRHIKKDSQSNNYFIGLDFQTISGKWLIL
ncbi:MAG: hypothetical protein FD167_602 [bacterium]|nr:MAG: hypothetical protein FD167_602 [bacterium]